MVNIPDPPYDTPLLDRITGGLNKVWGDFFLRIKRKSEETVASILSFKTINCPAGTDPVADAADDTLNLTTTSGKVVVTGTAASDSVDFDVAETALAHTHDGATGGGTVDYGDLGSVPATFAPAAHDNTAHSATYIEASGVTYGNLDANGDVGQVASTVAAGDDSRFTDSANHIAAANPHSNSAADDAVKNCAKAQTIVSLHGITSTIRGLWFFDQTGATTAITDRGNNAHAAALSANADTLSPGYQGLAPYLSLTDGAAYWETADHNDFTFGNGAAESAFSIVFAGIPTDLTTSYMVAKDSIDATGGGTQREYAFYFDGTDKMNFRLYDDSTGARQGRSYNTALTADEGGFHTYIATYATGGSAGINLYRDSVIVDDTDQNNGAYTAMENKTALVGSYYRDAANARAGMGKYKFAVVMITAQALTQAQVNWIHRVLMGYGNSLV